MNTIVTISEHTKNVKDFKEFVMTTDLKSDEKYEKVVLETLKNTLKKMLDTEPNFKKEIDKFKKDELKGVIDFIASGVLQTRRSLINVLQVLKNIYTGETPNQKQILCLVDETTDYLVDQTELESQWMYDEFYQRKKLDSRTVLMGQELLSTFTHFEDIVDKLERYQLLSSVTKEDNKTPYELGQLLNKNVRFIKSNEAIRINLKRLEDGFDLIEELLFHDEMEETDLLVGLQSRLNDVMHKDEYGRVWFVGEYTMELYQDIIKERLERHIQFNQ